MGRFSITEQEILEEILSSNVKHPEDGGAMTVAEICEATERSTDRVRAVLHQFQKDGRLEVVFVWRTCLDNRQQRKPAYRIKA